MTRRSTKKRMAFRDGQLQASSSNDPRETIGQVLVRDGLITEEALFRALLRQETARDKRRLGEILIRGPQIMPGYWNAPEETAAALRDRGDGGPPWLYTGDLGYLDADGFLFVVDRKKELIKTSGLQVWPREVEETVYAHPAVKHVVVVGMPDGYRGEVVKAFVVLKDGHAGCTEAELVEFCRARLTTYKVPRTIELRAELPVTTTGKVLRRLLR